MLIAVFSDMHGNREAFAACLAHAERAGADEQVFLGDYVGYGADPRWVIETVVRRMEAGAVAIRGNHDEGIGNRRDRFNETARVALDWTSEQLEAEHKEFLARLPLTAERHERLFVHASPFEPAAYHYVLDAEDAARGLQATPHGQSFCGHVHVPALYHLSATGKVAQFAPPAGVPVPLSTQWRWLAVLGAVGQPRDGLPAACYGVIDTVRNTVTYVRVAYDTDTAARKVRAAGLPEVLSMRLMQGF